jgi:phage-related protein
MQNLLQKAKELYANIILALGPLGTAIDTIVKAAIRVWNQQGEKLISEFLLALFAVWRWNKLMPTAKISLIGTALRLAFYNFAGRTFIESLPVDQIVKDTLNRVFDISVWAAIATPVIAALGLRIAGILGVAIPKAILGITFGQWAIIGAIAGIIIGVIDEKFNLGIGEWIRNTIPQNADDWRKLWDNIRTTFTERVIPFVTTDLPTNLAGIATSISEWLNKPIRLPTWEEVWESVRTAPARALEGLRNLFYDFDLGEVLGKLFDTGAIGAALGPIITTFVGSLGALLYNKFAMAFPLAALGFIPGWAAAAIGILATIVIGILDEKFDLGIRDFITIRIPEFLASIPTAISNFLADMGIEFKFPEIKFPEIKIPDFITEILGTIGEIDIDKIFGEFELPDFGAIFSPLVENFNKVTETISTVREAFGEWVDTAGGIFLGIWEAIGLGVEIASVHFDGAKEVVGGFLSEVGERFLPIIEPWKPVIEKIGRLLVRLFAKSIQKVTKFIAGLLTVISTVSRVFIQFVGSIYTGALRIATAIGRFLTPAINWITEAIRTMWEWVQPIVEDLWAAFKNAAEIIGAAIGTLVGIISTILGGIIDIILSFILDGPDAAVEAFLNMVGNIADLLGGFVEDAAEKWDELRENIKDAWAKIKRRALAIWEDIKDKVEKKWEEIKDRAKEIWDDIRKDIKKRIDDARQDVEDKVEEIRKKAEEKWDEIKANAKTAWDDFRENIKERVDGARQDIEDKITAAKDWLSDKFGIVGDFLEAGKELIGNLRDGAAKIFDDPLGFLATIASKVTEAVEGLLEDTQLGRWIDAGIEFVKNLVGGFTKMWDDPVEGLKEIAWTLIGNLAVSLGVDTELIGKWINLGADLIGGIIKGVWGMFASAATAVWDFILDLVGVAEDAAGDKSPATRFIPLGESIVEGVLKPIYEAEGAIDRAVNSMIGREGAVVVPVMARFAAEPGGMRGTPFVGTASSGGVNINITVSGNTFGGGDEGVFAESLADEVVDRLRLRGVDTTRRRI